MIVLNQLQDLESLTIIGIDPCLELVETLKDHVEDDTDARTWALLQVLQEQLSGVRDAVIRIDQEVRYAQAG